MSIVEIKDLRKNFVSKEKGKKKIVEAVKGITLNIEQGEIFGFLGPNGAGKTTTQRMLATLLPIDGGSASIAGFDIVKNQNDVRKNIGYVGQAGGSDRTATGWEDLMLQGTLYGMKKADIENSANELIELLDIKEIINRPEKTYSGGQKRRLEIALGLIHNPQVLFLDEPTTGLDPQNRVNLWNHIIRLKQKGMTIFLTTHYLDEADELCDRLAIVDHGEIVAIDTPRKLKEQISGDVIKIETENPQKTLKLFSKQKFVKDSKIEDEKVYLTVKGDGTTVLPTVFEILKKENITAASISLAKPTLDDVFLKTTGRSLRD